MDYPYVTPRWEGMTLVGPYGPIFSARAHNSARERVTVPRLNASWVGIDGSSPPTHVWWEEGIFMAPMER